MCGCGWVGTWCVVVRYLVGEEMRVKWVGFWGLRIEGTRQGGKGELRECGSAQEVRLGWDGGRVRFACSHLCAKVQETRRFSSMHKGCLQLSPASPHPGSSHVCPCPAPAFDAGHGVHGGRRGGGAAHASFSAGGRPGQRTGGSRQGPAGIGRDEEACARQRWAGLCGQMGCRAVAAGWVRCGRSRRVG